MSIEGYERDPLWPILVETARAMIMYKNHYAYTRDVILHEEPDIIPQELSSRLGLPLGESMVILYELRKPKE